MSCLLCCYRNQHTFYAQYFLKVVLVNIQKGPSSELVQAPLSPPLFSDLAQPSRALIILDSLPCLGFQVQYRCTARYRLFARPRHVAYECHQIASIPIPRNYAGSDEA